MQSLFYKYSSNNLFISENKFTYEDQFHFTQKFLNYLKIKPKAKILISANNSEFLAKMLISLLYNKTEIFLLGKNLTSSQKKNLFKNFKFDISIFDRSSDENDIKTKQKLYLDEISNEIKNVGLPSKIISENKDFNKIILNIFTSGTTGVPKIINHSFKNIYENYLSFNTITKLTEKSKFWNFLPMTYLGGYYNLLLIPFFSGGSVLIDQEFSIKTFSKINNQFFGPKVNTLWLTPTIAKIFLKLFGSTNKKKYLKGLTKSIIGMDSVDPLIKKEFLKKFKLRLLENYGLSETLFISAESEKDKLLSSGKFLSGIKHIKSTKSELVISSKFLTKNIKNKFFKTGDIFKYEKKRLYITGRVKDIIIKGGLNIYPNEIEKIISNYIGIEECSVFGLHDKTLSTELICVAIVPKKSFRENLFFDFCSQNLNHNLIPQKIFLINSIPKTSSGKVMKNILKSQNFENQNKVKIISNIKNLKINNYISSTLKSIHPPISVTINNDIYELKKYKKIITLSLGEAFFNIPKFNFNSLDFPSVYHYSHSKGLFNLRKKISQYFHERYEINFDPKNQILISAGSKIIIYMILKSLINKNDEVILFEPYWVSYSEQVKLAGGKVISVPINKTFEEIEKYFNKKTKLVIINNPNNPTGKIYNLNELSLLYKLADKYNALILSDEAYSEFCDHKDSFISLGNFDNQFKRTIIVNSISKNYGISGWRIGYAISNASIINNLNNLNQHLITCAPTILQNYVEKYFYQIIKITHPQIKKLLQKRKKLMLYMNEINLNYIYGAGTFYFFISIKGSKFNSRKFSKILLNRNNIAVVPGIGYGKSCDKFIRVSIGTESFQKIKYSLNQIKNLINKQTNK